MKLIQNKIEPTFLTQHRLKADTNYETFKKDIGLGNVAPPSGFRDIILSSQGYICAYCMKRIPHKHTEKGIEKDDMKIEHWVPQTDQTSITQKLDITYSNMFACCMGNEGRRENLQTCDTKKASISITVNPTNPNHIRTLKYAPDGSIHSTNDIFDKDIKETLNLNENNLKLQREAIYNLIVRRTKLALDRLLTRKEKNDYLDSQISWWNSLHGNKYEEFCMVAVLYLLSRKNN